MVWATSSMKTWSDWRSPPREGSATSGALSLEANTPRPRCCTVGMSKKKWV
jgi:hypothetical protein